MMLDSTREDAADVAMDILLDQRHLQYYFLTVCYQLTTVVVIGLIQIYYQVLKTDQRCLNLMTAMLMEEDILVQNSAPQVMS